VDANTQLENGLNQQIEDQKYYMDVPVPLTKLNFDGEVRQQLTKVSCIRNTYDLWTNYYFGKNANNIQSTQENSFYRGTFLDQVITTLSGVESTRDTTRSIGSSYDVFSTQVQANKGYNFNAIKDDLKIYDQNKISAKDARGVLCGKYLFGREWLNICLKKRYWHADTNYPCILNDTSNQ